MSALGVALAGLALASADGGGALRLPAHLSDGLVLQRSARASVWGWSAPGARVTVAASWPDGGPVAAEPADARGVWRVALPTPEAGGPFTLTVRAGDETRVIADVLVGEVWLAAGQSNMEWTLGPGVGDGVAGWEEAVRASADGELRVFDVANALASAPAADVTGAWRAAAPGTAGRFSAVAYFFARALRRELGVPVGIVTADWGGTPAEAWTPAAGLAAFPELAGDLVRLAEHARDPAAAEARRAAEVEAYWRRALERDAALGLGGAMEPAFDDAAWTPVELPATWEQHGLAAFDGLAWYRRTVEVPADRAGELALELGPIDDRDTVWWNGVRVGGQEDDFLWERPRRYVVPAELVRPGANVVAVRVLDTGGLGGFTGDAAALAAGGISLAGTWRWRAGTPLAELGWPPGEDPFHAGTASALWNGMVAPLVPSLAGALAGVIWYQGESNVGRAEQYERLFPALIAAWRAALARETLPFLFVQIAPFAYHGDTGQAARLRDAQRKSLSVPHTGMAVTMDVGDPADIHPLAKREVGERLARLALAKAYGRELECSGPLYRGVTREGAALRVAFDHAAGLTARGAPVRHVLVAGADRVFHPADARVEGTTLVVASPAVSEPVAVRFGWGAADATNLWNGAGLPASSFRSDDWP